MCRQNENNKVISCEFYSICINCLSSIFKLAGAEDGLTKDQWESMHIDGVVADEAEVYRLVYFGGVQHEIRKEVWPYLLGHYR